jgi:Uma2 family endonuclease
MPTIDKIAREIRDFEGFDVRIRPASHKTGGHSEGKIPGYKRRYNRIAWNTFTVNDWRRRRFDNDYPEYVVEVLRPDGKIATGTTALAKLRALYDRESKDIG